MKITEKNTLAEWASSRARVSRVLIKYGLDFCCGGSRSLEQACKENPGWKGLILGQHGLINWANDDAECILCMILKWFNR